MFPIVKVVWMDSERQASGWTEIKDIDSVLTEIETVGFLYADTPSHVTLIQSMDLKASTGNPEGEVLHAITIPKLTIKSIITL